MGLLYNRDNIPAFPLSLIKYFEGFRHRAYLSAFGVLSVGYGHTGPDVEENTHVTRYDADTLLEKDVGSILTQLSVLSPNFFFNTSLRNEFHSLRLYALVDFCYDLGVNAYDESDIRKFVNLEDWRTVSQLVRQWPYAGVGALVLPGLEYRSYVEALLLALPEYVPLEVPGG